MVLTPSSQPNSPKKTRPAPTKNAQPPKGARTPAKFSSSSKTKTSVPPKQKGSTSTSRSSKPSSKPAPNPQEPIDTSSTQTKKVSDRAEQEKRVRAELHEHQRLRSYALLDASRERAKEAWGYDSVQARRIMKEECLSRSKGAITPHEWQLDIAECLVLGIDCELIAPTGSGKTIAFMLPMFYWQRPRTGNESGEHATGKTNKQGKPTVLIIVSPLNTLEADQVRIQNIQVGS